MKRTFDVAKVIVLAGILALGMNYLYAAWSAPTVAPPGGNAAAPLNTSLTPQIKDGGLALGGNFSLFGDISLPGRFDAGGNYISGGKLTTRQLQVTEGAGVGKFLTSDGDGIASWLDSPRTISVIGLYCLNGITLKGGSGACPVTYPNEIYLSETNNVSGIDTSCAGSAVRKIKIRTCGK